MAKYTEKDLIAAIKDLNKVLDCDPALDLDDDMEMDDLITSFKEGAEMADKGDKFAKATVALAKQLKVSLGEEDGEKEAEKEEEEEKMGNSTSSKKKTKKKEKAPAKKDSKKEEKKPAAKKDNKKATPKKDTKKKTEKKGSNSDGLTDFIKGLIDRNMKEDTIVKKAKEKYPEKSYRILGNRVYAIQNKSK